MLRFSHKKLDERWGKRLFEIIKNISILGSIKPLNTQEQKKKFFSNEIKNPIFIYRKNNFLKKLIIINEFLLDIQNEKNKIIKKLYLDRLLELEKEIELINLIGIDDKKFYNLSKKFYGEPNLFDFKKALTIYKNRQIDSSKEFNPNQIKKIFKKVLNYYKLKNWRIVIAKKPSIAMTVEVIRSGKYYPILYIPKIYKVSKIRLQQLLAHEIETHMIRQENGFNSPLWILMRPLGLKNYLTCEEGLAVFNGKRRFSKTGSEIYGIFALYLSKNNDFRNTFEKLIKLGLNKELAWRRTFRVFRGIKNCNNSEGLRFTGDFVYWRGYNQILQFLNKNPKRYNDLYIGRTNIEDLNLIIELIGNIKNNIIPENLSIDKFI